jgi:nitrous oxidase accessory protein
MYSDNNTFEGNVFADNAAGAAIMHSKGLLVRDNEFTANRGFRAYGMLLNAVDATRIEENRILGNTVGIYMENSNANTLLGNEIANNYIGLRLTASSDANRFSRNQFAGNMHPAELAGQSNSNRWAVAGVGNHWGGTDPVDLDRDGIGDLPHREPDLLGNLRRPFPLAGLLSGSPALGLLRFAHERVALPGIQAIEDASPLTSAYPNDRR